ncbi:alpha-L-arabinofuranosidase C-terminal domain-containing protein [Foetidibacter luteolus]|uniref:alpha-L-arabinofuranosidase C-terminal domain-containing protein n=1 Tax=Foetidibacter luteolus TaxID=2608880 RepID=UPI00129A7C97|nr:alpha-L-arabinofuranosidase C-terminal domain-containing protein [Foetidibacter luteolus]
MKKSTLVTYAFAAGLFCSSAMAQKVLTVKANEPKAGIQPTMWGVFFEDINFGADGGLYAEMIKNRSFEFAKPLMGWTVQHKKFKEGVVLVLNRKEENSANPRFIRVTADKVAKGDLGLTNAGFRGMGIKKGLRYDFSVMYRQQSAGLQLHVELVDSTGKNLGGATLSPAEAGNGWHKQQVSFTANETAPNGKLNIWFEGNGVIDLDMISLFPGDTWKNRPGGMRADMVQMLADMKPGFVRFPGGCIVEGSELATRYQWKKTIGPLEERQLIINRWNYEYANRPFPDYFQSFGLGFFEYFQLCEDIGAEPVPILNCGMACQFNSSEVAQLSELDPYVQDALDLVEFANGPVTSKWGKVRADMGHPAPFNLKMMGIGNENWGPQYIERLQVFTKAIKAKYPDVKIVNSSGTDPDSERYHYLDDELRKMNADIIDEHYYRPPSWFLSNAKRYDTFPRNNVKVFAGEYAAHVDWSIRGEKRNNLQGAIAEAAYMTGLERNADVVTMASYAPLFAHIDAWQWTPDLIWTSNLNIYGSPSYYVQKLYSLNKGTHTVPITLNNEVVAGQDSLYASAAIDKNSNELIVKIVNASDKAQTNTLQLDGIKKLAKQASLIVLSGAELTASNSFAEPLSVAPKESVIDLKGKKVEIASAPYSFTVVRVKMM